MVQQRGLEPLEFARILVGEGARILQFRHKGALTREVFAQMEAVRELCREAGALFIVNDRADAAALLNAGLHLGQEDLQPAGARRVSPASIIGLSTHNDVQVAQSEREPVDYIATGPVFATVSKERPDPVVGLDGVRSARRISTRPLVAIGGITVAAAGEVIEAGAESVAVIGDLLGGEGTAKSIKERTRAWLAATK